MRNSGRDVSARGLVGYFRLKHPAGMSNTNVREDVSMSKSRQSRKLLLLAFLGGIALVSGG